MPERRARRIDALQNRERILAAALAALTESGDASINSIAQRAGVGNATLYRHFPTREALVLEVYQHEVRQLVDSADGFLSNSEPAAALQKWVMRLAQYAMTKHGLAEALRLRPDRAARCSPISTRRSLRRSAGCSRPPDGRAPCVQTSTQTTSFLRWPACGRSTRQRTGSGEQSASTSSSLAACVRDEACPAMNSDALPAAAVMER